MAKHVYGFPIGTNKESATAEAIQLTEAAESRTLPQTATIEVVTDTNYTENGEFAIVIRTPGETDGA